MIANIITGAFLVIGIVLLVVFVVGVPLLHCSRAWRNRRDGTD